MKFVYNNFYKILHTHAFGFGVFAVFVAFFIFAGGFVMANGQTMGPTDSHVVSLYINGQETIVPTRAQTVGDFLDRMNVKTNPADLVEPSKNTEIDSDNFRVQVYRAKPVTINDRGSANKILSPYSDPTTIAKKAGYSIYPEDIVNLNSADSFVKEGTIGTVLTIDRATAVMVSLYGSPLAPDRTQAGTVGDYLKENKITPEAGSNVIPEEPTPITEGLAIFIAKAGKNVLIREDSVPFETETDLDASKPINTLTITTQGKNGRKLVYYEVDANNRQTNSKVLHEVIIEPPIKQVQIKGTKAPNMAVSGSRLDWMRAAGISEGDFYAVDFVIGHESGWRPNAVSGSGCTGLGQACPGAKLAAACPNWASDPVCQLQFFSRYAGRYGGWQGAYSTWTRQGWW